MEKLFGVLAAVLGTALFGVSLAALVPNGNWLYLGTLVLGFQLVMMAVRGALKK